MRGLHLAAALSLLAGCTHVRAVRTLAAGETDLAIDEGGPIVLGVGAQRALFPFGSPGLALRHPDQVLLIDCSLQLGVCASALDLNPQAPAHIGPDRVEELRLGLK